MAGELHGVASYPGIIGVISCNYTCSHGITPGTVRLVCQMQDLTNVPNIGDVIITDGVGTIPIPGCRITQIVQSDSPPWTLSIYLEDRRWLWTDFGAISGCYNQPDPRKKLIPWTIRSPKELAEKCLYEMNEINYILDLPPGLDRSFGAGVDNWLQVGQQFPPTGTNPPVNWDVETPANVLQRLAETFGCRIIYDVINDIVIITKIGIGAVLPPGHIARNGPSIKGVPVPDGIMVVGSPTKYQCRLALEAVGEEWDGTFQPINQLSYAPMLPGQNQITTVNFFSANATFVSPSPCKWHLVVRTIDNQLQANTGDTLTGNVTALFNSFQAVAAAPGLNNQITAVQSGNTITFTGANPTVTFNVSVTLDGNIPLNAETDAMGANVIQTQPSRSGIRGWSQCDPNGFEDVIATPRLTYRQAIDLALKHVFKTYRLKDTDVSGQLTNGGSTPINIPGFGTLERRQQIVLTDTMVEQVVPALPNPSFRDPRNEAPGTEHDFIQNYYDGFSRDKPAVCYGQILEPPSGIQYLDAIDGFTSGKGIIQIPFSIDPTQQLVMFSEQCYTMEPGDLYVPAVITLETGVFIRDRETNQLVAWSLRRPLATEPGQVVFGDEVKKCPDVQVGVIGNYQFAVDLSTAYTVRGRQQATIVNFNATTPPDENTRYISLQASNTGNALVNGAWWIKLLSDPSREIAYASNLGVGVVFLSGMLGFVNVTANNTPFDFASTITCTLVDANSSITAGRFTIVGVDSNNRSIREDIILVSGGGSATYITRNSFRIVQSIQSAGMVGVDAFDTATFSITEYPPGVLRLQNGQLYVQKNVNGTSGAGGGVDPQHNADWLNVTTQEDNGFYAAGTTYALGAVVRAGLLAGTVFTITINGVSFSITTAAGDRFATIPLRFSDAINASVNANVSGIFCELQNPSNPNVPGRLVLRGRMIGFSFPVAATIVPGGNTAAGFNLTVAFSVVARNTLTQYAVYNSRSQGSQFLENDPLFRANYYLDMMQLKYQIKTGQTVEYNGIMPISCDGAVAQVTWSIGGGRKASTTVSRNCEHSTYLPPYPARRRIENLRPAQVERMLPEQTVNLARNNADPVVPQLQFGVGG